MVCIGMRSSINCFIGYDNIEYKRDLTDCKIDKENE